MTTVVTLSVARAAFTLAKIHLKCLNITRLQKAGSVRSNKVEYSGETTKVVKLQVAKSPSSVRLGCVA